MRHVAGLTLAGLLLAGSVRAGECAYAHPDLTLLPRSGARMLLLPPRAEVVDSQGNLATEAPDLAVLLAPEVHCRLEELGHEVDGHSLAAKAIADDAGTRQLVARTWDAFDARIGRACLADVALDPESLTLWDLAPQLAAPTRADALIFARARTLLRSKKLKTFLRTIQTVAPDARWPGPQVDVTWIEVAIVDGRSGRLLALAGVVEEADIDRHPARAIAVAIDRALGDLPRAGAMGPATPQRVIHDSKTLRHWERRTGLGLGDRTTGPRGEPGTGAVADGEALALLAAPASGPPGATLLFSRRAGTPALLVVNETPRAIRVSASSQRFVTLAATDSMLVDVDPASPWLVVTDEKGTEIGRADCGIAAGLHLVVRVRGR